MRKYIRTWLQFYNFKTFFIARKLNILGNKLLYNLEADQNALIIKL